jgi:hypothetical protein
MEDIRLHLLSKNQQWSNEDKKTEVVPGQNTACPSPSQSAPIVIEGVFDATVAVERVLRLAAKFVTAEEEAESRREEIEALKKRREIPSGTTTTDTAAFEETCSVKENSIDCSETIDETTVEMTSLGTADPDWVSADADSITPKNMSRCLSSEALECPDSPHPSCPNPFGPSASSPSHYSSCDSMSMRHVLSSVDPELIARLNKLLLPKDKVTSALSCSPSGRSTPSPSRGEADLSPEDHEEGREDSNITAIRKKDTETDTSTQVILDSSAVSPYRTELSPYRATRSPRRASSPHCATLSPNRATLSPCRTDISPFRTVLSTAQAPSSVPAPVPVYVRPPLPFKGSQSKLLQVH